MPKKRAKLPPGVVSLDAVREARRLARIRANAREFLSLPKDEQRRQLVDMLSVRVVIEEERPAEASQGPAVEPE